MKPTIKINADGRISAGVDNKHQENIVRLFVRGMTLAEIKRKNPVVGTIIESSVRASQ